MTSFFYPPLEPYPCGCTFGDLCDKHQALADAQRREVIRGRCLAEGIDDALDEVEASR